MDKSFIKEIDKNTYISVDPASKDGKIYVLDIKYFEEDIDVDAR